MPILNVKNWPSQVAAMTGVCVNPESDFLDELRNLLEALDADNMLKEEFRTALTQAALDARVPGIAASTDVSVSFDSGAPADRLGMVVVCVEGLFERPDRPKEVRDRLVEAIKVAIEKNSDGHKAEVLVHRFDPTVDSYARSV